MFATGIERFLALLSQAFEGAAASHRRASLLLVMACLALFLPGFFTLQPMDRDEPRFAQATKQMLETNDFVRIRFQKLARNNKPAGIYWAQAASVTAGQFLGVPDARRTIWLNRLPSLAGAIAAVLLTYWAALAFTGSGPALLAALLLASTILLGVEARLGKTDAVLLATIVAVMGALAHIYRQVGPERPWRLPVIFWTAIGVGLLVKGPITPMVPLLAGFTLAVTQKGAPWFRRLKFFPGIFWALLIALPWFVLILIETQGAFITESVGKDMLGKVASGKESHGAPPLTYFAAFWVTAWPMAPLAALAAPFVWANRRESRILLLLVWLVPVWLLFELVPTKLPHYVLPTYPAIAIMIAISLEEANEIPGARWRELVLWLLPLVAVLIVGAGGGLALYTGQWPGWAWFVFGPLALLLVFGAATPEMKPVARGMAVAVSALCLYWATYSGIMTAGPGRIAAVSPQLAAAVRVPGDGQCRDPLLATAGYYEPSLVYLTGTDLIMTGAKGAAAHLAGGGCRVALVERRLEKVFREGIEGLNGVKLINRINGININGGKRLDIGVWFRP